MKEGYLKKRMSLLKGYKDQWFQLSDDGYLKYFNEKHLRGNLKQRGKLLLLLSVTSLKKDLVSFKVTSADDEIYRLRADTFKKRNEWVQAINNIRTDMYNKMFRGVYDTIEIQQTDSTSDDENDNEGNKDDVKPMHDEVMAKPEKNIASLFKAPQKSFVAVAAIDFGTTYSGCAFSTNQKVLLCFVNILRWTNLNMAIKYSKAFEEKAQFMVVDLGGGTIDITVSVVLATGQLKEIYNATGGPWGGNYINGQIIKTLKEVIGWEVIRTFRLEEFDKYLELLRKVEQRKRGAKNDSELSLAISKDLSQKIKIPDSHKQSVRLSRKYIKLSAPLMKRIFSSSVNTMTKHVEELLRKKETRGVSTILLVGGYAASDFVQRAFREMFEQKYKIIFPLTPDMIVLKGAVIMGHLGEPIVDRMTKYHYGLGISAAAVSGRRISVEEDETKTFFSLIKKGQTIKVGDVVTEYEVVLKAKSQWAKIEVYTTDEDVPRTIIDEEHFTKVGSINVTLLQFKHESILILTITYCETEFKVIAKDNTTGRCFVGICRFLGK
ncbi:unnamed protein product [Mytilus coruscus]|uniref:PH domain-containing protein n=1 Tax=Mytilus coruscus TaxID=42192 RepID=A0A6J8BG21_MYTCO|nr:unnamed protein product [Mytilus coruscus]